MAYEQKDNSGSLFKNDRKESDKHPGMTGTALINGVEYWVSSWRKDSGSKGPWLSLAFKPKEERRKEPKPAKTSYDRDDQRTMREHLDDDADLPF